ncbi:MAG: hypothetical protein AAFP26_08900 [Planctomycetota bacterium]
MHDEDVFHRLPRDAGLRSRSPQRDPDGEHRRKVRTQGGPTRRHGEPGA